MQRGQVFCMSDGWEVRLYAIIKNSLSLSHLFSVEIIWQKTHNFVIHPNRNHI